MALADITSYKLSEIKPYRQYQDNLALQEFLKILNQVIARMVGDFFTGLKKNINLRTVMNRSYTTFYLQYYFGLEQIPNPSDQRQQTKNLWDTEVLKYETIDTDTASFAYYIYDDLIAANAALSSYLPANAWAYIVQYIVNYDRLTHNIDGIYELLRLYYYAMTDGQLDITTIKISFREKKTIFNLPSIDVWKSWLILTTYSGHLVGLPYGNPCDFQLYAVNDDTTDTTIR